MFLSSRLKLQKENFGAEKEENILVTKAPLNSEDITVFIQIERGARSASLVDAGFFFISLFSHCSLKHFPLAWSSSDSLNLPSPLSHTLQEAQNPLYIHLTVM